MEKRYISVLVQFLDLTRHTQLETLAQLRFDLQQSQKRAADANSSQQERAGVRTARQASVHGMTMLEWRSGKKYTIDLRCWDLHLNQGKPRVPRLIAG